MSFTGKVTSILFDMPRLPRTIRAIGRLIQKGERSYLPGLWIYTTELARRGIVVFPTLPEWKMQQKEIEFARGATAVGMRKVLRFLARYIDSDQARVDLIESFNRLARVPVIDEQLVFDVELAQFETTWLMLGILLRLSKLVSWRELKEYRVGVFIEDHVYDRDAVYRNIYDKLGALCLIKLPSFSRYFEVYPNGRSLAEVAAQEANNYSVFLVLQRHGCPQTSAVGLQVYIQGRKLGNDELSSLKKDIHKGEIIRLQDLY